MAAEAARVKREPAVDACAVEPQQVLADLLNIKKERESAKEDRECEPEAEQQREHLCVKETSSLYANHLVKNETALALERETHKDGIFNADDAFGGFPDHKTPPASERQETICETHSNPDAESLTEDEIYTKVGKESICDICGRSFALKSDLIKHISIHINMPTSMDLEDNNLGDSAAAVKQEQRPQLRQCWVRLQRLREPPRDTSVKKETDADCDNANQADAMGTCLCRVRLERMPGLEALLRRDMWRDARHPPATHTERTLHTDMLPEKKSSERYEKGKAQQLNCDKRGQHGPTNNDLRLKQSNIGNKASKVSKTTLQKGHPSGKSHSCKICKEKFTFLEHLYIHKRIMHTGGPVYSCEVCNKKFASSSNFRNHCRIHSGERPYSCEMCSKRFTIKKHMVEHIRVHTGEKPYSCDLCNKRYAQTSHLKTHKRIHSGEKPYSCDVCEKQFAYSNALVSHKRMHTGEKPYSCVVCKKQFSQLHSYKYHKLTHTGERPHACEVCKMDFTGLSHLKNHKKLHSGETPYSCEICNKQFARSDYYKVHKRIHTGEKAYSCEVCERKFAHSSSLINHTRVHHRTEKPYVCEICTKSFALLTYYNLHKRVHTGEKPYWCDICEKQFALLGSLQKHRRVHTGEKPYSCEICKKQFSELRSCRKHKEIHLRDIM